MKLVGWIDEVDIGRIWCRVHYDACPREEYQFDMKLTDVPEDQRGYIEPGAYISFPNGSLLVHKTVYSTFEIERADAEAKRLLHALTWGCPVAPRT